MAFLIADNRLTENSSWDERMLGEQLKILSELKLDFDLEAIGFEVPEIDLLIDGLNTVPEADPDDRLPAISESAISVLGDLWQLGKLSLYSGNWARPMFNECIALLATVEEHCSDSRNTGRLRGIPIRIEERMTQLDTIRVYFDLERFAHTALVGELQLPGQCVALVRDFS
jgi:hypothetical protein